MNLGIGKKKREEEIVEEVKEIQNTPEKRDDLMTYEEFENDLETKEKIDSKKIKNKFLLLGWPIAAILGLWFVGTAEASLGIANNQTAAVIVYAGWVMSMVLMIMFAITWKSTITNFMIFLKNKLGFRTKRIIYVGADKTIKDFAATPNKSLEFTIRGKKHRMGTASICQDLTCNCQSVIAIEGNMVTYDITDQSPALDENLINSILIDLESVAFLEIIKKFKRLVNFSTYQLGAILFVGLLCVVIILNQGAIGNFITQIAINTQNVAVETAASAIAGIGTAAETAANAIPVKI